MSYKQQSTCSNSTTESWITAGGKQRSVNPVPLSTASTAAPSPRLLSTQSPPPGFSEPSAGTAAPLLATPSGTFTNDCPPSPTLTKRLLGQAQSRKRAGRHNLVSIASGGSNRRVLKLSVTQHSEVSQPIDRWGIPDDVYDSLVRSAGMVKKCSGQHLLERRRLGLSGEPESVLVIQSKATTARQGGFACSPHTVSLFSPDPSLF
jgi:hypothetical protein